MSNKGWLWRVLGATRCIVWVCNRSDSKTNICVLMVFEKVENELVIGVLVKGDFMVRIEVVSVYGWWFDQWWVILGIVGVLSVIKDWWRCLMVDLVSSWVKKVYLLGKKYYIGSSLKMDKIWINRSSKW